MADAIIDIIGPEELPVIVTLYNQIFRPNRTVESFQRRYQGRHNVLQMVAHVNDRPVGFNARILLELKPSVFFSWFYGVLPDFRRQGIASQLMEGVHKPGAASTNTSRSASEVPQSAPPDAAPGHRPEYATSSASVGTPTAGPTCCCSRKRWSNLAVRTNLLRC